MAGPGAGGGLAGLWAGLALRLWSSHRAALPAYLAFGFACVVLAVIDARTHLLPNRLTYPAFGVVAVLLGGASLVEGDLGRLWRAGAAAALLGMGLLGLALLVPGGLGFGDVKFAPTVGLALGWLSWGAVSIGFVAAFLLGGVAALGALLVLRRGRGARLAFGPWMAAGALLAVLAGAQIAAWYGHALLGT